MDNLKSIVSEISYRNKEDTVIENMLYVMKEFNFTLDELSRLPVPAYLEMLKFLNKLNRQEEKAYKKAGRKR